MRVFDKIGLALFFLSMLITQVSLLRQNSAVLLPVVIILPLILTSFLFVLPLPVRVKSFLNFYRITLLLLGPFASFGMILMTIFSSQRNLADSFRELIAEEAVFNPSEKMDLDLYIKQPETENTDIAPYIVVMESQNSAMKRNTINKVVQHPSPNSRVILDKGLQDEDPDIRFYAASALIILNDEFIKEFREIQKSIETNPTDAQLHLDLALAYQRYCSWNLPEAEDRINYIQKMQQAFEKTLQFDPGNIQAIVGIANTYIDKANFNQATNLLQRGLQRTSDSPELAFLRIKLLFERKKFGDLRRSIQRFKMRFSNTALEFQEFLSYWEKNQSGERWS